MKNKSFFKGLSWLLILNLIVKPVWIFAIDRQVQNVVGHEAYGAYFSLLNLSIVFLFVADAGLSTMITRHISDKKRLNTNQLLRLKLVLLVAYAGICCVVGWAAKINAWNILLSVITIQALGSMFLFLRSLLTANQFFKTDAVFSVVDKALMIVLCSLFLYGWWKPIRIEVFLLLQAFSIAVACLLLFIVLVTNSLIYGHGEEKMRKVAKSTIPFAVIILLMSMHYRLDGFLLERIRLDGAKEAGIYATAYRLLDAANMIGFLMASFLVPFTTRNKADKELISSVIIFLQHRFLFLAIMVSSFAFVFPAWIQQTLYHTNDATNNTIFQLCLAVLPAYYIIHIYGSLLTSFGQLKPFISILFLSVLTNIILNFILIPNYGATGCCMAAIASQYTCAIACYLTASKNLILHKPLKNGLIYLLIAAFCISFFLFLKTTIPSVWIILAVAILLSAIIAAFRIKSLKLKLQSLIQ